jgi:hypothetical protein
MERLRTPYIVPWHSCTDAGASARTLVHPCGRGSFTPGNLKKDATVRPSHGRLRGHRPIVRPSVRPSENIRVTTLIPKPTGPGNNSSGLNTLDKESGPWKSYSLNEKVQEPVASEIVA